MYRRWLIPWLLSAALSGCVYFDFPSEVPEQLEGVRSQVVAGKTSRKEVRARLGAPFISDERVEVYRVATGYDVTVGGPLPSIFFWGKEEVISYALLTYDENDLVEEIDWGIYQEDTQPNPADEVSWISATLHAAEFDFGAFSKTFDSYEIEEMLLAPISESQHDLKTPPPPGMCAVLVFAGKTTEDWRVYGRLHIDGKLIIDVPLVDGFYWHFAHREDWVPFYEQVFTKTLMAQGAHEISVTTDIKPHGFRRAFECKAGETYYAYPHLELVEGQPWGFWRRRFEYAGDIKVDSQPSGSHEGWRRLLFYRGEWLGD
jgi:hypothetical protein